MNRSMFGWLVTTIVAALVHEMASRHLAGIDLVRSVTQQNLAVIPVAAALLFARLWLMFLLPLTCAALVAARLWRWLGGPTDTERRLRRSL